MGLVKNALATGLAGAAWMRRGDIMAAGRRFFDKNDAGDARPHGTGDRAPNSPVPDVPPR